MEFTIVGVTFVVDFTYGEYWIILRKDETDCSTTR